MRRVTKTSFTIAIATLMIGLAVTQARADRVSFTVDRCFGADCFGGSARVGQLSLAFTESSLGVVDPAASASAVASFSPDLGGISGVNFAGVAANAQSWVGNGSASQRTAAVSMTPTSLLPTSGLALSFSRLQVPAFATSLDLGRSISTPRSGSFSVTGVTLNANSTSPNSTSSDAPGPNGAERGGDRELPPGGAPVPEPATMLLLGTGLAGAAAVIRKRLKSSRR